MKEVLKYITAIAFAIVVFIVMDDDRRKSTSNLFRSKPYLELSEGSPFELRITEFSWGYGLVGFNEFSGDFEKLDEKVFDNLKGKAGICKVYLEDKRTDKYGKESSDFNYVGDIDLTELNQYQNWEFWHKSAGIRSLILKSKEPPPSEIDSVAGDYPASTKYVEPERAVEVQTSLPKQERSQYYTFTASSLYPVEEERNERLQTDNFEIDGVILDSQADFSQGRMKIRDHDNEELIVQFYPSECSSAVANDLLLAMKTGNKIKAVCARAGASTLDLISATVTKQ